METKMTMANLDPFTTSGLASNNLAAMDNNYERAIWVQLIIDNTDHQLGSVLESRYFIQDGGQTTGVQSPSNFREDLGLIDPFWTIVAKECLPYYTALFGSIF